MIFDTSAWHAVARSCDVRSGDNIVAGFAIDKEMALWRSVDGSVQAWENRCPHRSVRFTLGQVLGDRLSCAYHGWQYMAGDGHCVGIPAHPSMAAPKNVCAKVFRAVEAGGMVWVNLDTQTPTLPPPQALNTVVPQGWNFCRTLTVRAESGAVCRALDESGFDGGNDVAAWRGTLGGAPVIGLVLNARPALTFIHLWTAVLPGSAEMTALHASVRSLRGTIESHTTS